MVRLIESFGPMAAWGFVALFVVASLLMIWRLEALTRRGVEGTVLGTIVMPYCSGMGNIIFAFLLAARGGRGEDVLTNSIVNNVTNMTLLIGLPALIWGLDLVKRPDKAKAKPKKKSDGKEQHINRLSLLLSLTAVGFFSGAVWALARDRNLDFSDGLVLVGLFLFWQCFHLFDVLKGNVRQGKVLTWMMLVDLALLGVGAWCLYVSTDWLVSWISKVHTGFVSAKHLGWLSGWLMVLPNGLLAIYYARQGKPEVVYTSQVGDGHISIPLCIGIFALSRPIYLPKMFSAGLVVLVSAAAVHFASVLLFGRLPRWLAALLVIAYGYFLYRGLVI